MRTPDGLSPSLMAGYLGGAFGFLVSYWTLASVFATFAGRIGAKEFKYCVHLNAKC